MAIKAEELMIGNYILYAGLIHQVQSIYRNGIETTITNEVILFDRFSGIPLSDEIFLKCGFQKNTGLFKLSAYSDGTYCVDLRKGNFYFGNTKIEYLHHFQNLFYAWFNTHLTFKP